MPDPLPHASDLARIAREVLPLPPRPDAGWIWTLLTALGRALVAGTAMVVAVVALPGLRFLGDGSPPLLDVVATAMVVGAIGATYLPLWRHLVGSPQRLGFGASVFVWNAALLRLVEVAAGEHLQIDALPDLLLASIMVTVPSATAAAIADVVAHPEPTAMPD